MYEKVYLIDSENVSDEWVNLLDIMEDNSCIIVFYTDKSTHMNCNQVCKLMEKGTGRVQWIKCFGGNNALDFQLVSELGAMIERSFASAYVIVSKDNGYNPVVRYWGTRGVVVSKQTTAQASVVLENEEAEYSKAGADVCVEADNDVPPQAERLPGVDIEELAMSVNLKDNALLYSVLVAFEGQQKGAEEYRLIRDMDKEEKADLVKLLLKDKKERGVHYVEMLLKRSNCSADAAPEIYDMLVGSPKKSKDKYHKQLTMQYGKAQGLAYFQATKAHYNYVKKL